MSTGSCVQTCPLQIADSMWGTALEWLRSVIAAALRIRESLRILVGPRDDAETLRQAAGGNSAALGRLYDGYAPLLMAVGTRMLGTRDEAADVVHDVFVEVWKHAGEYDSRRASVKTWLVMRMRSRCLDRLKAPRRQKRADWVEERHGGTSTETPENDADGSQLREALSRLPEEQSAVLMMGYFQGMSSTEIAAEIGVPIGTVKSRVAAGMTKLRSILGASVEGG